MAFWMLTEKGRPLQAGDRLPARRDGFVRVRVAGCGLCHTDLGFIYSPVATRAPLPLVLGHEISGWVDDGSERQVLIPAVIPCGECAHCRAGSPRTCPRQIMPGNDIHGGFGPWVEVPERALVPLPRVVSGEELARLAVVADAVTTPLQALHNVGLAAGQVAVVIGCGGVGTYACLLAQAAGARVVAMDIDDGKLEQLGRLGVEHRLNTREHDFKAIKAWVRAVCADHGYPDFGHRILETSGSRAGQELAFGLLNHAGALAVVGFTLDKVEVRLSNLMALDARAVGNWGADPALYPEAIERALSGVLRLADTTELVPLSEINATIARVHTDGAPRRVVLCP